MLFDPVSSAVRRISTCLLALLFTVVVCACGGEVIDVPPAPPAPPPPPPPPPEAAEVGANTHALLVGVTKYPNIRGHDLKGGSNDVAYLKAALVDYLRVEEKNITTLTEEQDALHKPDRTNIMRELKALADKAKEGDRVIFHFSGHGSQVGNGDASERDGWDELMLARDLLSWSSGKNELGNAIRDDEIRRWSQRVSAKGADVWMIFDCCKAGTMSRGPGETSRHISAEDLGVPPDYKPETSPPAAHPPAVAGGGPGGGRIVSFYAASEQDDAKELFFPRLGSNEVQHYGLMTYALVNAIRLHGAGITFAELERHMVTECRKVPHNQRPWADGDKQLYVGKDGVGQVPLMLAEREGSTLWLNAGRLRGLSEGTIVTAYAEDKEGNRSAVFGRARIAKAGFVDSLCEILPEPEGTPTPSVSDLHDRPVRVTMAVAGDLRVPIHICDETRQPLPPERRSKRLKRILEEHKEQIRDVPLEQASWLLQKEGPNWFFEAPRLGADAHRIPFLARDLRRALANLFHVQTLLGITGVEGVADLPDVPKPLLVEGVLTGQAGTLPAGRLAVGAEETRDTRIAVLRDGAELTPGEPLQLRVCNQTFQPIDLTVLGIDAQLGVYVLYPRSLKEGGFEPARIEPKGTVPTAIPSENESLQLADDAEGMEYLLILAVPHPKKVHEDAAAAERIEFNFTALQRAPLEPPPPMPDSSGSRGGAPNAPAVSSILDALSLGKTTTRGGKDARTVPTGLCARLIRYRNKWGRLALPADIEKTGVAPPTGAAQPRASVTARAEGPPSPWFVGTKIAKATDGDGMAPAVVAWDKNATWIYLDADGDAGIPQSDVSELAARIADGALDVEMVVRLSDKGNMAWYAVGPSDDRFTLVLAEAEAPDGTVVQYSRGRTGAWSRRVRSGHWLSTTNLKPIFERETAYEYRTAMTKRLHAFRTR
jgi:hypothetical protein